MDKKQQKKLKKVLLNMLGRNPAEFLLISQDNGWISLKELHKALLEEGSFSFLSPKALKQYFSLFRPDEFEIDDNFVRVRPSYLKENLFEYPVKTPPKFLFFPIRTRAYLYVKYNGLKIQHGKKWNILCSSREKATLLGKRFCQDPIIAKLDAKKACEEKIVFHYAGHEVYLCNADIGSKYIELPQVNEKFLKQLEEEAEKKKAKKKEKEETIDEVNIHPGTFFPSIETFEKLKRAEKYSRRKGSKKRKKGKRR